MSSIPFGGNDDEGPKDDSLWAACIWVGDVLDGGAAQTADSFPWRDYRNYPDYWYDGSEAKKIAYNVLSNQSPAGDWPKGIDTGAKEFTGDPRTIRGSFENGSTLGELRFLAAWRA